MQSLCNGWEFIPDVTEDFLAGKGEGTPVRLPHTAKQLPLHYADHKAYQMVCGYRRKLDIPAQLQGKRVFLQFDAAGHIATVYVNGKEVGRHNTGYTAFRVEVTDTIRFGEENLISVKLDTTENPATPPFGGTVDYLTYGGLYREVWLDVREQEYITDLYITTPAVDTAQLVVSAECSKDCVATAEIIDEDGTVCLTQTVTVGEKTLLNVPNAKPWSCEAPNRYICRVTLSRGQQVLDVQQVKFGFRTIQFAADGFYLNGKKTFMRGLNHHQSYPYIGYAAPESLQREDVRILKEELGCNTVRTSHYPQSHYFIDECDRLGLLVFTEIPGWQHIGNEAWQDQAVENVREMVLQYRNHPSIVMWGVRINESQDNDPFYLRTNALAHELDPSRPTSGVRYLQKSSLLEDVYSFNDFSHTGANAGCLPKKAVTMDMNKGLLISEHDGHMFPTKTYDNWERRQSQALRHARVLNDAYASGVHAGCIGWCMFDYATHKEFGSGDRICYHGVMDSFRNPKLAAYMYLSQQDEHPVLVLSSTMDTGDYNASRVGDAYIFTNADKVRLYRNNEYIGDSSRTDYPALPHGPIKLDVIGHRLQKEEGVTGQKEKLLRKILLAAKTYGLEEMPAKYKRLMAWCMVRYRMNRQEFDRLYGEYIGNWGSAITGWRLEGIKDGKVVSGVTYGSNTELHLQVVISKAELHEEQSYDMTAVRIRILDAHNNPAVYAQLPVKLELEGPAELVGPETVTAEGGMCGAYIRTVGQTGTGKLRIVTEQTEAVTVEFAVV